MTQTGLFDMLETTSAERAWEVPPASGLGFTAALCRDVDTLVEALRAYMKAWGPSTGEHGWEIDAQAKRRARALASAVLGSDVSES